MASKIPAKKSAKKPAGGARAATSKAKVPARKPAGKAKVVPAKAKPAAKKAKPAPKSKAVKKPAPRAVAAKPAVKSPVRSAARTPVKASARPSAKPLARPLARSSARPSSKPASKVEVKPPVKLEVNPKARPSPQPEFRPEAKSEPKPAAKPTVKPRVAAPAPAPTPPAPVGAVVIAEFREKLLRKRDEIRALYRNDLRLGKEATDDPTEDIVDRANNSYSRELSFSISDAERNLLLQIDEAIKRLDSGAFGRCGHCGRAVAGPRLEALPWARLCIDCQELLEKGMLTEA